MRLSEHNTQHDLAAIADIDAAIEYIKTINQSRTYLKDLLLACYMQNYLEIDNELYFGPVAAMMAYKDKQREVICISAKNDRIIIRTEAKL